MVAHFDDFCLWINVVVDDMCQELEGKLIRPGPRPACSDSEMSATIHCHPAFGPARSRRSKIKPVQRSSNCNAYPPWDAA